MSLSTLTIADIQLWGYHGCFPEERITGTKYAIDFSFQFDTSNAENNDEINNTIDYSKVYDIIVDQFNTPVNLIEHLGRKIINAVNIQFPEIRQSTIKIKKYYPPLYKFNGYVEIIINNP